MTPESAQAAPKPDPTGPAATSDPLVDALVQQAAHIQSLPVGEHNRLYGELLDELTAELDADPGSPMPTAATGQAQP